MLPPLPPLAIYILDAYAKNNKYSYSSSYTITISCVLSQAGIPCLPLPVQNIHRTPSILSTTTIGCILLRAGVPCLPISVSNHFLHYELPFLFLHLLPLLFFQEYLLCYQLSLYSHTQVSPTHLYLQQTTSFHPLSSFPSHSPPTFTLLW